MGKSPKSSVYLLGTSQSNWLLVKSQLNWYVHDQSRTCICKLKQGKARKATSKGRQRPKADSEKNTETGFKLMTTGLLVQCSANRATMYKISTNTIIVGRKPD